MAKLYYFHDPMCSWCWGYRPVAQALFSRLPENVLLVNVLGGLAPDSDEPMGVVMRNKVIDHWRSIEKMLGTNFNYDFWKKCKPRRSTYPACRAVIAAARQGLEENMILAIQKAYYLEARNPSDKQTLVQLAKELSRSPVKPGRMNVETFKADLETKETEQALQQQISFARELGIGSLPSLVFEKDDLRRRLLTVDYLSYKTTLVEVKNLAGDAE